jgi:hypothetical protein
MAIRKFYFVAGEQLITRRSHNELDAWLGVRIASRSTPVAKEFATLPITAHDEDGNEIATHTWDGWNREVLKDTYGEKFEEVLEAAEKKMR